LTYPETILLFQSKSKRLKDREKNCLLSLFKNTAAVCGMDEFKEYLSMRKHLSPKKQHVIITINTIKNGLLNN